MLTKTLTIPSGQTESDWLETATILGTMKEADQLTVSRLVAPATLPGITSIGFESKYSAAGDVKTMKDTYGTNIAVPVSANADVPLPPSAQASLPPFIRLKSNVAASGANRSFEIGFRHVE